MGPLEALKSCLNKINAEQILFCAVDMPLVDTKLIDTLLSHSKNDHIICFKDEGRIYPLPGLYPQKCLQTIYKLQKRNTHSLISLLANFPSHTISANSGLEPQLFNMNTQTDYQNLKNLTL